MSVTLTQLDGELRAAERALEAATERRDRAENDLWALVRRSGRDNISSDEVVQARADLAEADGARKAAEAAIVDLRQRREQARQHELRLRTVIDVLIARDEARRLPRGDGGELPTEETPEKHGSWLGRLFGR